MAVPDPRRDGAIFPTVDGGFQNAPLVRAAPARLGTRRERSGYEPLLWSAGAVAAVFVLWHFVTQARMVSQLFLPGPLDVVAAYGELIAEGGFERDVWVSAQELIYGYGIAAVTGVVLGLLIGWYDRVRWATDPFINFFYATPRIVLLPLLIIWFGIGMESKVAVVFLGAFFAIVINTAAGVRNVDPHLVKVARSFGAKDLWLFRTVALPGAVPFVLTGLRLGTGHALIGVVVGELVAAQYGIGKMMMIAGQTFQSSKVFAGLFLVAGAGMLMTFALQRLERRFDAWRPQR